MMAKQKLYRYAQVGKLENVVELDPRFKGRWATDVFANNNPIVLELACGKGHYTLELAKRYPNKNLIGVDIKGERIYIGAIEALQKNLRNAAFLRTQIEDLNHYFEHGEVGEVWITFPDPYLRKPSKRLTSPRFLKIYSELLPHGGLVHLKTDDSELHAYTLRMISRYGFEIVEHNEDIYANTPDESDIYIKTFYEGIHLAEGRTIRYVCFRTKPMNPEIERP
jgi:tRNA (guanine-N7-)-methyltransferase